MSASPKINPHKITICQIGIFFCKIYISLQKLGLSCPVTIFLPTEQPDKSMSLWLQCFSHYLLTVNKRKGQRITFAVSLILSLTLLGICPDVYFT